MSEVIPFSAIYDCSHLQSAAFSRVEHQESAKDPLTVCGHIKGDAVLSP